LNTKGQLIGLQYLRGVTASIVVLHHLYFPETQLGPFGVKLFFVISGLVMYYTTSTVPVSPIAFWRQRTIRIVPLYWLFLSLLIVVALVSSTYLRTTELTPRNVILSFLFIPHFHEVQKFLIAPILIPGWSLNYEMFFYFVFGLALLIRSLACRVFMVGVLLWALVLLGLRLDPATAVLSTYTNPALLLFLNGILLAMIYQTRGIDGAALGLILASAGTLLQVLGCPPEIERIETFLGIAPALIVAGILGLETTLRRAPIVLLRGLGDASYSIYLSHLFFLRFFEICWQHIPTHGDTKIIDAVYLALAFVFAITGGVAVHYVIERPIMRLFRRRQLVTASVAGI
jgi:exopolysaccharide production protein ExoZ